VSFGCTGQCGAFKTELLLHLALNLGLSCSTTFNNELWTSMPPSASPLYAIGPCFRNFVHKKAHPGAGGSNHLRKRLLTDFCNDCLRLGLLTKICQQQEQARQTFLARSEELIHEVFFDTACPSQKMRNEHLRERWFRGDWRTMVDLSNRNGRVRHSQNITTQERTAPPLCCLTRAEKSGVFPRC
jgi:hypothetical protein